MLELEIISNYSKLSICQMFLVFQTLLQLYFPSCPLIYIRERKRWIWLSHGSFLILQTLDEFLERSYFSSITILLVVYFQNSIHYGRQVEAYLKPRRTYTMEIFCENRKHLKAVIYFRKKASFFMFDRVLHMPLAGNGGKSWSLNKTKCPKNKVKQSISTIEGLIYVHPKGYE